MGNGNRRILMIGQSAPLLEGVSDLLQLVGYQVDTSTAWADTEVVVSTAQPNLVIVDLSDADSDTVRMSEQIRKSLRWSKVPLLFVSFSGDDRIRELQRHGNNNNDGQLHYYAHSLLSMDGLVDKVQACLT